MNSATPQIELQQSIRLRNAVTGGSLRGLPKTAVSRVAVSFLVAVLAVSSQAQFTADYQTNTIGVTTNWTGVYTIGNVNFDLLQVTNGGKLTISGELRIANTGTGNQLIVTNGGQVASVGGVLARANTTGGATNNAALVSGNGSLWNDTSSLSVGGNAGYAGGNGNRLIVNDSGQVLVGGSFYVGGDGSSPSSYNQLTINGGGMVVVSSQCYIGAAAGASNNSIVVSGDGSLLSAASYLRVGNAAPNNSLIISNNSQVVVANAGTLMMGVTAGASNNTIQIRDGGLLEANNYNLLNGGAPGESITNCGGIIQFSVTAPFLLVSAGQVVVTNGTISFRGIANANLSPVAGITYQGANTFRLNNATNAATDYTFDTGLGAGNYAGLEMVSGGTAWRSSRLTIGSGGRMLISNTAANVQGVLTNSGVITVVNSSVTFDGDVVNRGRYIADPSTSTFSGDLTVTPSGTLEGTPGDVFDFKKSLFIQSTNNGLFNLASSVVSFSGGGNHTNAVTGGDFGTNLTVYPNANFSYGTLTLASATDQLYFVSGGFTNGLAGSNALYVTQLNLFNNSGALDSSLVANLHSAFNIYYLDLENNAGNSYLNDTIFSLDGGGRLMPFVPEPSAVGLSVLAACGLLRRKSNRS